jgi:hypothetical protein
MRSITLMFVLAILISGSASAQQQSAPKAKASNAAKKCTYEACVARGLGRGFSSSTAGTWCSSHNNGC